MPAQQDITAKKNDGTTDIVYTKITPAAGDGVPAVWRALSIGTAQAHRPEMRVMSKDSDRGTKRMVRTTYKYPQIATNSTTGLTSVVGSIDVSIEVKFEKTCPQTDVDEAVSQSMYLQGSTHVKDQYKQGQAAT